MSFKSWNSYREFSYFVRTKLRYILDDKSTCFLNSIINTCQDRTQILKKDTVVWRAQNGHYSHIIYDEDPDTKEQSYVNDFNFAYPFERMKPLVDSASEGRANPKGIPCLYVATDKETAMAEVRPWLGSIMSVGQFKLTRELKIIVFATDEKKMRPIYLSEPSEDLIIKSVWSYIDNAFSEPTKVSDQKSDYAPTQIISEFIKSKGYDGISYKSSLAHGHNIAFFDLGAADVFSCSTFRTSKIDFKFGEIEDF